MTDLSEPGQDIIFACGPDAVVKGILYKNTDFCDIFEEGEFFFKNVQADSLSKALTFYSKLKTTKNLSNYEINFFSNMKVVTLILSGNCEEDELIIFASSRISGFPLYDEIMAINSDQINYFRKELKKKATNETILENNEHRYYDEISHLNNELTNVQRELSKKNNELNLLNMKLEELTIRDPLTDLYNKRYLEIKYKEEINRSERFEYPISLVMIDFNHFKQVNDQLGHHEGDMLLIKFAELSKEYIRQGLDYAFRVGGDEFILLLTHCEEDMARNILQRLDTEFRKYTDIASLAYGVISFVGCYYENYEMALKEIDAKMYSHKNKTKETQDLNSTDEGFKSNKIKD